MSLPIPLSFELRADRCNGRFVTKELRDFSFRWTDPGGYATCRISLDRPLTIQPDEIAYYSDLTVYDSRSGDIVWDGRLEDPGRSAGDGQVWDLAAVGGQAHTRDRTIPLIYVDRNLSPWTRVEATSLPDGQVRTGEDETVFPGEPSMIMMIPNGTPVTSSSYVSHRYMPIARAGQKLARLDYKWDAGRTEPNFVLRAHTAVAASWSFAHTLVREDASNTAGGGFSPKVIGTDFFDGDDAWTLRVQWIGSSSTVNADTSWGAFAGIVVLAVRYNKSGSELVTGASYTTNHVLAHEVVEDLLGRLLTAYDGANAVVAATTHQIQQLAYPDGVTPEKVLADLLRLESGHTWRVWERNRDGLFRFEWVAVPSTIRYEADIVDGYDAPGSADGIYNRVTIRWRDSGGHIRATERSATVPELDAQGLIRQALIDLGDEVGSQADAQRAGDQWLADHRYAPNAGRLTIHRPILDLQRGGMVMPWEIKPGLIRVRGIRPRVDALNSSTRDGVTIFRIVAGEVRSDGSAVLELDSYAPSTAQMLADLQRRPVHRRR